MSKITLPIAELKPALAGLGKVIGKRATLRVLQHIKIERTTEGWLALTATDLDTFITVRLEQPGTGEPISLLVPYDELLKITKNSPKTDNLLVSGDGSNAIIEYAIGNQVATVNVATLPVEEFPPVPRIKGEAIPLNDTLRQSINDAMECSSTDPTRLILNGVRLMALAESLGGVETLISHPATMTHASVPAARRQALGITDGLVRISAGIEDLADLQEDIDQALARL